MSETLLVLEEPGQPGRLTKTYTIEELLALCASVSRKVFAVVTDPSGSISLREIGFVGTTFQTLSASQSPSFPQPEPKAPDPQPIIPARLNEYESKEERNHREDEGAGLRQQATLATEEQPSSVSDVVRVEEGERSPSEEVRPAKKERVRPSRKGRVESAPVPMGAGAMTFGEVIAGDPKDKSTRIFGPDAFK